MIIVKVFAPDASFGMARYNVDKEDDVTVDEFGVLTIRIPPREQTTATMGTQKKIIPATRSSKAVFPHGSWTRLVIEDVLPQEEIAEDTKSDIAAFWGIAENEFYIPEERLKAALAALEKMSKLVPGWDD